MLNKNNLISLISLGLKFLDKNLNQLKLNNINKIKLGSDFNFPPYNFKNNLNEIVGLEIDLVEEICGKIKLECEWIEEEWDNLENGLKEEKYDIIVSGLDTELNKKKNNLKSKCYIADYKQFAVLRNNSIFNWKWKSLDIDMTNRLNNDFIKEINIVLKDKKIGVQKNSIHHIFLKNNFSNLKLILFNTQNDLNISLLDKDIDILFSDVGSIINLIDSGEGINVSLIGPRFYGYGFSAKFNSKNANLINKWNSAITELSENGTIGGISKKWLGRDRSLE